MTTNAETRQGLAGGSQKSSVVAADASMPHGSGSAHEGGTDGQPDRRGAHVIVPLPWCSCGGALGIATAEVVGFEPGGAVVQVDLSSCSTRPTPPHCSLPPLVYTRQEIEELRWVL